MLYLNKTLDRGDTGQPKVAPVSMLLRDYSVT